MKSFAIVITGHKKPAIFKLDIYIEEVAITYTIIIRPKYTIIVSCGVKLASFEYQN